MGASVVMMIMMVIEVDFLYVLPIRPEVLCNKDDYLEALCSGHSYKLYTTADLSNNKIMTIMICNLACMLAYAYIHACTHTRAHTCTPTHTHMHIHTHIHTCIYMHTHMHTHTHTHKLMNTRKCIHTQTHTHTPSHNYAYTTKSELEKRRKKCQYLPHQVFNGLFLHFNI